MLMQLTTGVKYRIMTSIKTFVALMILLLALMDGNVQAKSADLTIKVSYFPHQCVLEVPSEYNLGNLTPGRREEHADLNIQWACLDDIYSPIASMIYAYTPSLLYSRDTMYLGAGPWENPPRLSLRNKRTNSLVYLDAQHPICGDGSTDSENYGSCTLTPITEVDNKAIRGPVEGEIIFFVAYP